MKTLTLDLGLNPFSLDDPGLSAASGLLAFRLPSRGPGQDIAAGFSIKQLMGVLSAEPFVPSPADLTPQLGLISWNNQSVPVIDLGAALGLGSADYCLARRLVFLRCTKHPNVAAIPMAGDFSQFTTLDDVRPAVPRLKLNFPMIRGAFETETQTIVVPDLDRILGL